MDGNDHDPSIAFDRSGTATAVWSHEDAGKYRIFYSRRVGSDWTQPKVVSPPANPDFEDYDPAVAFGENGRGLCLWVRDGYPSSSPNGERIWYSCWDGTAWSQAMQMPYWNDPNQLDSCAVPEVVFTSDTSDTAQAVAIWLAPDHVTNGATQTHTHVWFSIWQSGAWTNPAPIPGQAVDAKCYPYQYHPTPGSPASVRLSLSSDNSKHALAVWQGVDNRLYWSELAVTLGVWTTPVAYQPAQAREPAAAYGPNAEQVSVFPRRTNVCWYQRWPLWSRSGTGFPLLKQVYTLNNFDYDPRVAWLAGQPSSAIAVWSHTLSGGDTEIWWSRWNDDDGNGTWVWTPVQPIVRPNTIWQSLAGPDMNPDIAAPSGSHTMPPQQ